jgi:twitching motility protein PilT
MILLNKLFRFVIHEGISDLFLVPGEPPMFRRWNKVSWSSGEPILDALTISNALREIAPPGVWARFEQRGEAHFAFDEDGSGRFRAHYFHDKNGLGAAFRAIPSKTPDLKELGHLELIQDLCQMSKGLILVTGPPSSGKTTTVAALVNHINETQSKLITTIEQQVEFRHKNSHSFVTQIPRNEKVQLCEQQVRMALHEGCEVLILDELSSLEELELAMHVSELGPLVIAVTQGLDAVSVLEWLMTGVHEDRRQSMCRRLATNLRAILNQRLLNRTDGQGLALATEILLCSSQISQNILDQRIDQIPLTMRNASRLGMIDMNSALLRLVGEKHIEPLEAYREAVEKEALIDGFRRAGIPFSPPRFSDMQVSHAAHRHLIPVRFLNAELSDLDLGAMANQDEATTIDKRAESSKHDRKELENEEAVKPEMTVIEPALLELGHIINASARARLILQHPNSSESIIELFGGLGILYGRNILDRQRGLRNDWLCQAFPPDNPEAQRSTRRISRIHGGFRVPDDGGWQIATWGESGLSLNDVEIPTNKWLRLPSQPFQLDIAQGAVRLEGQAFRAQSLVLKRPLEERVWYVVLRHRVDFGLTKAGFDVAAGLSRTQFGFGIVYTDGHFTLIPGMAGHVTSHGKAVESHRQLEPGMSIEIGNYSLTFQALMVKDPAR